MGDKFKPGGDVFGEEEDVSKEWDPEFEQTDLCVDG